MQLKSLVKGAFRFEALLLDWAPRTGTGRAQRKKPRSKSQRISIHIQPPDKAQYDPAQPFTSVNLNALLQKGWQEQVVERWDARMSVEETSYF